MRLASPLFNSAQPALQEHAFSMGRESLKGLGAAIVLHALALLLIWGAESPLHLKTSEPRPIMASILSSSPTERTPEPPKPTPKTQTKKDPVARPLLSLPASSPTSAPPVAPTPPPTTPAAANPLRSESEPASAPRFDADYLNNPKPPYPPVSQRLGEEGQVVLRVLVGTDGKPAEILINKSSGSERLDRAAKEAVSRWTSEPAKRNTLSVSAWVLVPITFQLRR